MRRLARSEAVFQLFWEGNWGRYPTNDIDMYLIDPNGEVNATGATLRAPERVVVADPTAGIWTVIVQGFTVHERGGRHEGADDERFVLRASADGKPLKAR